MHCINKNLFCFCITAMRIGGKCIFNNLTKIMQQCNQRKWSMIPNTGFIFFMQNIINYFFLLILGWHFYTDFLCDSQHSEQRKHTQAERFTNKQLKKGQKRWKKAGVCVSVNMHTLKATVKTSAPHSDFKEQLKPSDSRPSIYKTTAVSRIWILHMRS